MMKNYTITPFILLSIFWGSCTTSQPDMETQVALVETPSVLPGDIIAENGATSLLDLPITDPNSIALDLGANPCSISWSNNGVYLPCPGSLDEISDGYAARIETPVINGAIQINQPALLTIPAQSDSSFAGIFGKLAPFSVQNGDRFKAVLACADKHPDCDLTYTLEYYAADNQIYQASGAKWAVTYDPDGSYTYADISLDALAGQTVQFLLVVRDNGDPADDFALWIQPQIVRKSSETPSASQPHPATIEYVTVSGKVDMASAPPYLYDDHPPGSPAAVVLFNVGAPQIYWTNTAGTHPEFSLEVVPGSYYLFAYAQGVGEVPYVSAAFTGLDPSCGQPMQYIVVEPGKSVSDVLINDWNWSCGGTAERFEKPVEVPLP